MDEIHQQLQSAYCQFSPDTTGSPDISGPGEGDGLITGKVDLKIASEVEVKDCSKKLKNEMHHPTLAIPCLKPKTSCNTSRNA